MIGTLNLKPDTGASLSVPVVHVAHCCLRIQPSDKHQFSLPIELRRPPVDAQVCSV